MKDAHEDAVVQKSPKQHLYSEGNTIEQYHLGDVCASWILEHTTPVNVKSRMVPLLPPPYLQVGHPFLKGLRVVSQEPLLLQELGVPSVSSRLEEAVVVDVPQRLAEGGDDLLLGAPHHAVLVELEAPLKSREVS